MQKTIKTSSGLALILPTPEEENFIKSGIAADGDTYELTDAEFAKLKPMRGRPTSQSPKIFTAIRFDEDILEAFKASGRGWQTRMNCALKDWLKKPIRQKKQCIHRASCLVGNTL